MNATNNRNIAKKALIEALEMSGGDTKNQEVVAAIEKLASLNPKIAATEYEKLLQGNWLLINAPNFPDRQQDARGRSIYTLGRLAFNMFEPVGLKVEIERVLQPVFSTDKENEFTYDIVVEFKTIDENMPELKGIVKNLAICSPQSNTIQVKFVGGELMPREAEEPSKMKEWLQVFGGESRSPQLSLRERIKFIFIKWMFGISKASKMNTQTGKRAFTMKKSPKGRLKLLYLDDELRITKGNRETVLVCQRQDETFN